MDWEVTARGLVHPDCVLANSSAASPIEAFEEAAAALALAHGIDAAALVRRLGLREGRGSTAVGRGFAIPHADSWGLTRPQGVYLRSRNPIEFFATRDHEPVHDVLLLVAPRPATPIYSRMLQHYSALIDNARFRERLLQLQARDALWLLWRENEWSRDGALTPGLRDGPARGRPSQLRVRHRSKAGRS